jgi:hypothetical protein
MSYDIGVVERVYESGDRLLCDAVIGGALEKELILAYFFRVRTRPEKGSRVLVAALDGDDVQRLAFPFEFATTASAGGRVDLVADEIRAGSSVGALTALTDGVVVAQGIDTFTGATYGALGNASSRMLAEK